MRCLLLCAVLLVPATSLKAQPAAPRPDTAIPAADLFRPASARSARLNPAGTHVAMLVYSKETDATGLLVYEIATGKTTGLKGSKVYDVRDYTWLSDDWLVFNVTRDNRFAFGLYAMQHRDSKKIVELNRHDVAEILGTINDDPHRLLVWIRQSAREQGRQGDLIEIDAMRSHARPSVPGSGSIRETGVNIRRTWKKPKSDGILRWYRDRSGEPRYAVAHDDGRLQFFHRTQGDTWESVPLELDRDRPLAVDTDPNVLIVARQNPEGLRDIVRYDTVHGKFGDPILRGDKYDLSNASIIYSRARNSIVGINYARDAATTTYLNEEDRALQEALDSSLPQGRINRIVSSSHDEKRLLVLSTSDRHPGTLYLFDSTQKSVASIVPLAPWLAEEKLASMKLLQFKARDGLRLDGYVTLPPGHDMSKPYPTIVLPHGGPWVRDQWGFDPESQFFASRGYVVFQPNYRGSAGYDRTISEAPRLEFRRMHEDVTDGINALVKAGLADRSRIAIVGASFGGYLAVCGAAYEPDLYRCAVTIAGIFDWERVMAEAKRFDTDPYRYQKLLRDFGNPKEHQEKFEALSPYRSVGQIKIPVFVAHGEEDRVAAVGQSRRLVKAMAKAGVRHEAFFQADEGHGFAELKNRIALYERIESFLAANL